MVCPGAHTRRLNGPGVDSFHSRVENLEIGETFRAIVQTPCGRCGHASGRAETFSGWPATYGWSGLVR